MEQSKRSESEVPDSLDTSSRSGREATARIKSGNLILLDRALEGGCGESALSVERWPGLVERVQGAARYIRAVEERAQEQELHVQELLRQVRADMDTARAQVQAAERETHEVHAQAIKLIQAAEDRAAAAEQRAAAAEQMLQRIADTIDAEFVIQPGDQTSPAHDVRGQAPETRAAS